jgi:integrase
MSTQPPPVQASPQPPRLLDLVRQIARQRFGQDGPGERHARWTRSFILFHNKRHPRDMGAPENEAFLTHLAVNQHVAASTQKQAFFALLFLYQQVLQIELPRLDAVRARRPERLPVVMSRAEVRQVLQAITGAEGLYQMAAELQYGSGLRVLEACRLRVHDIDLDRGQFGAVAAALLGGGLVELAQALAEGVDSLAEQGGGAAIITPRGENKRSRLQARDRNRGARRASEGPRWRVGLPGAFGPAALPRLDRPMRTAYIASG